MPSSTARKLGAGSGSSKKEKSWKSSTIQRSATRSAAPLSGTRSPAKAAKWSGSSPYMWAI